MFQWRRTHLLSTGVSLAVVALVSLSSLRRTVAEIYSVQVDRAAFNDKYKVGSDGAMPRGQSLRDFTLSLSNPPDLLQILDEFRRKGLEVGIVIASIDIQESSLATNQLGRRNLTIAVRGSYANIKHVLSEVLNRFPGLTATRITMRRGSSGVSADASVTLAVWNKADTTPNTSLDAPAAKAER